MVSRFDNATIRKRRRTTSTLVGVALLCFSFHLKCFVHSFQSSFAPKQNGCDATTYKNNFFQSHRIRRDGLSRLSIFGKNAVDLDDTKTEDDEQLDEKELGEVLYESDYCYVNLDDISMPFVSREDSESTFVEYTDDGLCLPAGPVGQLKESVANFVTEPSVEILIASVVLLNSLLVALSTLDNISDLLPYIRTEETIIGTIFLADFLARWFSSCRDPLRFILDPQFALDILVVILPLVVSITPASLWRDVTFLPTALSQPSGLFNLQLLRVLRLQRFLQDLDTFERFVERATGKTNVKANIVQDWQLQLARVALSLFTLISVATGLIYTAEQTVNPNINNYFDALYFGLTTLTTVGFGDVSPVTWQGRLIVCGSIVFGVAVVPAQAAALLEALLDREEVRSGRAGNGSTKIQNKLPTAMSATKKSSSASDADDSILALDTTMTCSNCGASFHWSNARYCYRCGATIQEPR